MKILAAIQIIIGGIHILMPAFKELLNTEDIISIGLVIALFLSIANGTTELSTNIASGLIGYLGRGRLQSHMIESGTIRPLIKEDQISKANCKSQSNI